MSQMVASLAGGRLLAGAQQPITRLIGLFAGTCAVLWSLCDSWLAARLHTASVEVSIELATILWLDTQGHDYALMALFLAATGWLVHDDWLAKHQLRRWQRRACRDPLTGVANRRALGRHMRRLVRDRRRSLRLVALVIDLDDFKQLNDRHGHQAGDQALRQVAAILKNHFKRRDDPLIARWGGDEFIVVLPHLSHARTEQLRLMLTKKLRRMSVQLADAKIHFGASVGYAVGSSTRFRNLAGLVNAADLTLLNVKRKRHQ
jgi:diguanylate cyclase (GGDEF)-like protein